MLKGILAAAKLFCIKNTAVKNLIMHFRAVCTRLILENATGAHN